ncbi:MAG: 50S ribosomal protein L25 [bacterium]
MSPTLQAEKREETGKSSNRQLRENGKVPAVIYGRNIETENLQVDTDEVRNLLRTGAINNVLVELDVQDESNEREVLIKDVDIHPVNSTLQHVDFHQVTPDDQVQVKVPIELEGQSIGVEQEGGIIDQPVRSVKLDCPASDIPESIKVDIEELEIGDAIFISDLEVPQEARILENEERTVLSIQPPKEFDLEPSAVTDEEEIEEAVEEALEEAAEGEEGEIEVEEGEEVEGEAEEGEAEEVEAAE